VIYLDSSVLIYAVEDAGTAGEAARAAFATATEPLAISALTEMECLVGAFRRQDAELEADYRAQFGRLALVVIDRPVFEIAARLLAAHDVGAQHAIHWAAALSAGCSALLTSDALFAKRAAPFAVQVRVVEPPQS
jgi:predicted nucleic acid-binding protein